MPIHWGADGEANACGPLRLTLIVSVMVLALRINPTFLGVNLPSAAYISRNKHARRNVCVTVEAWLVSQNCSAWYYDVINTREIPNG